MKARLSVGSMRNQCAGCGATFAALGPFDDHRIGTFGVDRRCRTAAEIAERGYRQNERGDWRREMPHAALLRRQGIDHRGSVGMEVATSDGDALEDE